MLFRPDHSRSGRFSLPAALPFPATTALLASPASPAPPAPPALLASPASPPAPAPSRGFAYRSSRDTALPNDLKVLKVSASRSSSFLFPPLPSSSLLFPLSRPRPLFLFFSPRPSLVLLFPFFRLSFLSAIPIRFSAFSALLSLAVFAFRCCPFPRCPSVLPALPSLAVFAFRCRPLPRSLPALSNDLKVVKVFKVLKVSASRSAPFSSSSRSLTPSRPTLFPATSLPRLLPPRHRSPALPAEIFLLLSFCFLFVVL